MITAYPVRGKAKSAEICRAFIEGCGGAIATNASDLLPGQAFFYGVDESNVHLWRKAKARGGFYYCDNAYFDSTRQMYFRVTPNALQHSGRGASDCERFAALGIPIKPWKDGGGHIVVCPQSEAFMKLVVGDRRRDWVSDAIGIINRWNPDIEVRVRDWQRDKAKLAATLGADLEDAYALVTWSSAAAITAALEGVPVIVLSEDCAARPISGNLCNLEKLSKPPRENWAGVLADNQWTLDEFRDGTAWRALEPAGVRDAA